MSIRKILFPLYFFGFIAVVYATIFLSKSYIFSYYSGMPYYNYLTDAFLHGRLSILPHITTYDLSLFHGKWYLYWGPAPILVILPFYLLGGIYANSMFYTGLIGFCNVLLFSVVVARFIDAFTIKISVLSRWFVIGSFAFCSPNMYLLTTSGVWSTEQIVAIFYLLLCYIFYFSFIRNPEKLRPFLLAVIFYNLAWLSRYSLVLQGFLFLYPLVLLWKKREKRSLLMALLILFGVTSIFVFSVFIYNMVRFDNLFETGIHYQVGAKRYMPFQSDSLFSFHYILHNVYYYFFNIIHISLRKPYLTIDPEGNSVFQCYPLLFFFCLFSRKKYWLKNSNFLLCSLLVVGSTVCFLMLYFATGWTQFGNRFFFDIIPLLFLLTLFILKDISSIVQISVLVYGFIINFYGILIFDKQMF